LLKIIKQRYSRLSHIKTTAFYKTNVGAGFRICFAWFFTELSRSIEPAKNNSLLQTKRACFIPSNPPFAQFLRTKKEIIINIWGFTKRISFKNHN